MSDFDDSASACAIDALSIICKRSSTATVPFHDLRNEEVNQLFKSIRSGDASRNELDEASSLNVLWCGVVLVLKSNVFFEGNEDVSVLSARLPVHVQRFFGALFSTFEIIMNHQRDNSTYLVQSLVLCVQPNAKNAPAVMIQLVRDYKSLFSYTYIFNRRTGSTPVSQLQQVTDYFQAIEGGARKESRALPAPTVELLEDDDNDSYDRLMRASTDHFAAPKFSAPTVMPLRPVKMLSDDEHYGSDYQPAVASDLETDVLYNTQKQPPAHDDHLALMNDDSMYSMDGGDILSSYYKYNGWNNTVEEDEDSGDDHYEPPAPAPHTKRMTRMRQQQAGTPDGTESGARGKKGKKKRKKGTGKKSERSAASDAAPASAAEFTYKGGKFRTQADRDEKPPLRARSASVDQNPLDMDSSQSSPDTSRHRRGFDSTTDSDLEDSAGTEEQSEDDEASDFSVEPVRAHVPPPRAAIPPPKARPGALEEVEDFEPFPDEYVSPAKRRTGSHGLESHSPSSVGSSIELSDKEKFGGRQTGRNSNGSRPSVAATSRTGAQSAAAAGPGRIRSVLSDEDSDPEVRGGSRAARHQPVRNPLDESIETPGFGYKAADATPAYRRNPLDQSVEEGSEAVQQVRRAAQSTGAGGTSTSSGGGGWASASSSRQEERHGAATAPSARSVVRLPTASPSKPSYQRDFRTEDAVDLVTDWDSPQVSEEEKEDTRREHPLSNENKSYAPPPQHSEHVATFSAVKDSTTVSASRASIPASHKETESVHVPEKAVPAASSSQSERDRAAGLEKMRENILKKKREKELAAFAHAVPDARPAEGSAASRQHAGTKSNPPLVSILRKSVTFVDERAAAPPVEDAPSGRPPPHEQATAQSRLTLRGSVDDTVLYGSRQSSIGLDTSAMSWNGDSGSEEPSPAQPTRSAAHPAPEGTPRNGPSETAADRAHSNALPAQPHVAHASAGTSGALPLTSPPQLAHHGRATTGTPSSQETSNGGVAAMPAELRPPTVSRIPSERLLPPTQLPRSPSPQPQAADSPIALSVSRQSSSSALTRSTASRPLPVLPENFQPPPLSEFALSSGVILEGYLHKKSSGLLGQWQKRYFVLAESTTCFCVLRIFSRAVVTAWGTAPVGLHASIPIYSMESVEALSQPAAKGKEFTIKFCPRSAAQYGGGSGKDGGAGSETGSVYSDSGDSKVTTLMADDAETRMLWVTMLQRALAIATEEATSLR